ncbi:MAG TPA: ABC transporter permease subunit [Acetobacteraceae bacterium]|jgi:general L-amino acid transport system permease protein|nr:ABC transporter permease subunit [Acetobacteraceae bacterium]
MSATRSDPRHAGTRRPPRKRMTLSWSDPKFRALIWQIIIIGAVAWALWYLISNTSYNLEHRHIATGFAFLDRTAGIPIGEHLISYDPAVNTYGRAIVIAILNTLNVSIVTVLLVTIIGTVVGIAELSNNWLVAKLSATYVEVVRDIPVLLQLLFWYTLVQTLPVIRQAWNPLPGIFISNRGIYFPKLVWQNGHTAALMAFILGIVLTVIVRRRAQRVQDATGERPLTWPVVVGLLVVLPLVVWAAFGAPFTLDIPARRGFNFAGGGLFSPEYVALVTGLVVYTSTYAAENVRTGILAVPRGQWEAAGALGLRRSTVLRTVVLPQSLRVIIPPMTSTYLGAVKNSSLAVAIGYQDVVSIMNTILNQTGQAIEGIALVMAIYLCFSLGISLFMNWYNARIALVER